MPRRVLVVGAGKIGGAIVDLFAGSGDYDLFVVDRSPEHLALLPDGIAKDCFDVGNRDSLDAAMRGREIVVNAAPFSLTTLVAEAAHDNGLHYFDLTEDVESTRRIRALAETGRSAFVPQCGLAPGFIAIVTRHLADSFAELRNVFMRVGALPQYPSNQLKYNLTWSTDGLINEYLNPCDAIANGQYREVQALEGYESFSLDGVTYEAFNTSGGLGTMCESFLGRVENLNYKTVRYPGHWDMVKLLVRDLRLGHRRELLRDILETSIPMTLQDVVLIFVTVSGLRDGRLSQETYAKKIYSQEIDGARWSAIQLTTAAGICAMVDLVASGRLPDRGFVKQEQAALPDFLANRFGRIYA